MPCHKTERYDLTHRAFGAPRFQVLFRRWMTEGDAVLEGLTSDATTTAIKQGIGDVQCHVLAHQYRHLSPLLDGPRRAS